MNFIKFKEIRLRYGTTEKKMVQTAMDDIRKRRNIEKGIDKEVRCNNKVFVLLIYVPCIFYSFVL